jgi:hypothetical protein
MPRTVNIEVYCDFTPEGSTGVFAVASEHRPDLPKPFNAPMQEWARATFADLEVGGALEAAGDMEYEPNGGVIGFRRTG